MLKRNADEADTPVRPRSRPVAVSRRLRVGSRRGDPESWKASAPPR